jgi:hypothetical protein
MEFCSNRTVDYSGLEAGVGRAKCRGYHRRGLFDDEMSAAAECVDVVVVRNPQPQRLRLDLS